VFYIVSYDIPDDRKRTRVSKTMFDFGTRVQDSVFECIIKDDEHLEKMIEKLSKMVSEEDSVRIYPLCAKCEKICKCPRRGKNNKR